MSPFAAHASRPVGERVMADAWWSLPRGLVVVGVAVAVLLLGTFYSVVVGAVERRSAAHHATSIAAVQVPTATVASTD